MKNKYKAHEGEFIILVGSENGNTFRFALAIHQQLLKQDKRSYLAELNHYNAFPEAKHLIILTATYGLGEAPTNARKFEAMLTKFPQQQQVSFSVLGFGSQAYPDFCKFAFEVNHLLSRQSWAKPLIDIHTVNDKSPEEFNLWAEAWSQQAGIPLTVLPELNNAKSNPLETLTVIGNTSTPGIEDTFLVRLKSRARLRVTSGDLLAIYPENDYRERLYSIGLVDKEIRLSIRLHEGGIGSSFLHDLKPGEKIKAKIINNKHFHFPAKAPEVVLISNGTGIAPFLGMICQNKQNIPCHLYCGFRSALSFIMHKHFLEEQQAAQRIIGLHTAFSRDGNRQYVSNLIERDNEQITRIIGSGGVIMICGSLAMQKDIIELLDKVCLEKLGEGISFYQSRNQVLTDCY